MRRYLFFALILFGILTLRTIVFARISAKELAGVFPYCIQIPSLGTYVEAKTFFDYFPFRMWGSGNNHHAVLIVKSDERTKYFHWSYKKGRFLEGALGPPPAYCKFRENFLETHASNNSETNIEFYYAGKYFSIPMVYNPSVDWAGSRALRFFTHSISNQPIEVKFGTSPLALTRLYAKINDTPLVEESASEFGLQKQFLWKRNPTTGEKENSYETQYFIRANNGEISTRIECNSYGYCGQTFVKDGLHYYFRHTTETLSTWQTTQDKLVSLVTSFVVPH